MSTSAQTATSNPYVPVQPFPVTATSVLTQNYVNSTQVLVDPQQASAVAPFCNPLKGGAPEAFVILEGSGAVQYLAQDNTSQTGWSLTPLPGGPGSDGSWPATGVVAAVTGSTTGLVDIFWDDGAGNLQHTWLQTDLTFATPQPLLTGLAGGLANLAVSYFVPSWEGGVPVPTVYGVQSDETLTLATWNQGPWVIDNYTGSTLTQTTPFQLYMCSPQGYGEGGWMAYCGTSLFGGALDLTQPTTTTPMFGKNQGPGKWNSPPTTPETIFGQCFPTLNPESWWAYMLGEDGVPYLAMQSTTSLSAPVPAPTTGVVQACAVPMATVVDGADTISGLVSVYVVGGDETLSLLRQIGWTNGGLMPLWAPPVPLAPGVAGVFPVQNPSDPATLFVADAANALHVYAQSVSAALDDGAPLWGGGARWAASDVSLESKVRYELSSYMTRVSVTDATGVSLAGYALELTASAPCGVQISAGGAQAGSVTTIVGSDPVQITTGLDGTATFGVIATDFAPPALTLTDPDNAIAATSGGAVGPVSFSPAAAIQSYLSSPAQAQANGSTGTLPYLPPQSQSFTPDMMQSATVPGGQSQPLFPGLTGANAVPADAAVSNINDIMGMGYAPPAADTTEAERLAARASGPVGFIINNADPTRQPYLEFTTLESYRAQLFAHQGNLTDFSIFSHVGDLFSDAWEGIKSAATAVANVGVDLVNGVVSIAIWIGDEAVALGDFVITCVEDACNAVMAVFSALEAIIKDVIDFLKALFGFGRILDTQWAFTQAINQGVWTVQQMVQSAIAGLGSTGTPNFFQGLQGDITQAFDTLKSHYGPTTSIQGAAGPAWQPLGEPPSNSTPLPATGTGVGADGGAITPADLVANPQAMWLQGQMLGAVDASGVTADDLRLALFADSDGLSGLVHTLYEDFQQAATQFAESGTSLETAVDDLFAALTKLIAGPGNDPDNFENVVVYDLLDALEQFILAILEFLDGCAIGLLTLVDAALDLLLDAINQPIPQGLGSPVAVLGSLVQDVYDVLWDVASIGWSPPSGGWTPPQGSIPGWDPSAPMPRQLTYAGLAALGLAFPYTVLFEIMTGREPFPHGVLNGGADVEHRAVDGRELTVSDISWEHVAYLMVQPVGGVGIGLLTVVQDSLILYGSEGGAGAQKPLSWLTGVSTAFSFLTSTFTWPADAEGNWWDSNEYKFIALVTAAPPVAGLASAVLSDPPSWWEGGMLAWEEWGTLATSLGGVAYLIYDLVVAGWTALSASDPSEQEIARWAFDTTIGVLNPLPTIFTFLLNPSAQEATGDIPVAGAIKLILDLGVKVLAVPALQITEIFTVES